MQFEEKIIEKFGFKLVVRTITETLPQWNRVFVDSSGEIVSLEDPEVLAAVAANTLQVTVDWRPTGNTVDVTHVNSVIYTDPQMPKGSLVELFSTPDGPIMGIVTAEDGRNVELMDPCVISYDGKRVSYLPIFNVGRRLTLMGSAIRTRQAPCEVLIANYPSFVIQNRMFLYQLKPTIPMAVTPEVSNQAVDAVTINAH